MPPPVDDEVPFRGEPAEAGFALKWFCVLPSVTSKLGRGDKVLSTELAVVINLYGAVTVGPHSFPARLVHWWGLAINLKQQ